MAIKGKGKTKQKAVARAPRRDPVAVPRPFVQRRWVQVTAGVVLGMGIVLFIGWVVGSIRASAEEERKQEQQALRTAAVERWRTELETQFGTVGTLQDPLEPRVADEVVTAVDRLARGRAPNVEERQLETVSENLAAAADALEGFDLPGTLADQGFNAQQVDQIITSRTELVLALRLYQRAADLAVLAIQADDEAVRTSLVETAKGLTDSASEMLADGWRKYQFALSVAGIQPQTGLPPITGLPGG